MIRDFDDYSKPLNRLIPVFLMSRIWINIQQLTAYVMTNLTGRGNDGQDDEGGQNAKDEG